MSTEIHESTTKTHIDETHERGPFMQLFSGTKWHPHHPRIEDVRLADMIATARICRFGGHSLRPYSVASHEVYVATMLARDGHDAETQFCGLVHDAHEAYFPGDVPAPMKRENPVNLHLASEVRRVEYKAQRVVRMYLGVQPPMYLVESDRAGYQAVERWQTVRRYDLRALATERHMLMAASFDWELDVEPFKVLPIVHRMEESWGVWLARLAELAEATGRDALAREARSL